MEEISTQAFYDLVVPRLFEVASYQKIMCGKVENIGKGAQSDVSKTDIHCALTYIDQFTQDYILIPLYQHWPFLVPIVEEDTGLKRHYINNKSEYSLVMDPIDGTAFYIRGDSDYSIILGLMRNGEFEIGLICYPEENKIIAAIKGEGAWIQYINGEKQKIPALNKVTHNERQLACHYRFKQKPYDVLYSKLVTSGCSIVTNDDGFGTNATGILRITNGESSAFIGPHISLHDFAVPAFVIQELGGIVCLFSYGGAEDISGWDLLTEKNLQSDQHSLPSHYVSNYANYGYPDPNGANPRFRVIIANSADVIARLLHVLKT